MCARPYSMYDLKYNEEEVLKRSKKTRSVLIVAIILLIIGLGVLCYFSYNLYIDARSAGREVLQPPADLNVGKIDDIGVPKTIEFKKTTVPDLAALFGLGINEVEAKLGKGFKLTKSESVQDPGNPNITHLAVFTFTPELVDELDSGTIITYMPNESVYASLDQNGKVIDIYYTCDLRLLDVPLCSYEKLLSNDWLVLSTLQSAGITPLRYTYTAPVLEETIKYDNVNSENRKITKQTYIFSGRTTSQTLPTAWTLTVNYDYGSGVQSPDHYEKAIRVINLKLA